MKRKTLLMSAISILSACQAHAASKSPVEQRYTQAYSRCLASAEAQGQTSAVIECNAIETRIQDGKLNQTYKMVMVRLPTNRQEQLRRDERNWIKLRNFGCAKEQHDAGVEGTLGEQIYSGCILDETIKRTIYLEHYW